MVKALFISLNLVGLAMLPFLYVGNVTVEHQSPSEVEAGGSVEVTITLNKGETYFCRSSSQIGTLKPGGTKVVSNKKIAITIKDDSILTPWAVGRNDLLGDQIVGTSQIGFDHIVIKGPAGNNDHAFIFATEDSTEIWIDDSTGMADFVLNEGAIYSYTSFTYMCYCFRLKFFW